MEAFTHILMMIQMQDTYFASSNVATDRCVDTLAFDKSNCTMSFNIFRFHRLCLAFLPFSW